MDLDYIKRIMMDIAETPVYGLQQAYWKFVGPMHCIPEKKICVNQYDKIHEDLLEEDKFLLVILDACRYDYFLQEAEMFFDGDLDIITAYSSGRNTFEYSRNTWDGYHKDVRYVSGATPVNGRVSKEAAENGMWQGYIPGNHLNIRDVWLEGWSDELGTVPPENVKEATVEELEKGHNRVVAHFFQPHAPYIGEEKLVGYTGDTVGKMRGTPPDSHVWSRVRSGEITDQELRKAYRSNLREALSNVVDLVEQVDDDRRIVITADHAELLGDGGMYEHRLTNHPLLRKVPWMEVQK